MTQLNSWKDRDEIKVEREKTYRRFSRKSVFSDILEVFMVNRGLFFTFKELAIRPGKIISGYLGTKREKVTGPVKYFFLAVGLLTFFVLRYTHTEYFSGQFDNMDNDHTEEVADHFQAYFLDHLNLWSALGVLFFAWMSKIFWKKQGLFYMEHLVINLFMSAQANFYTLFLLPLTFLIGPDRFQLVEVVVIFIYYLFAFQQVFRQKFSVTLWKTILVLVLGYMLFFMAVMLLGFGFGIYIALSSG